MTMEDAEKVLIDGEWRPADATGTRVVIETNTRGRDGTWTLEPECAP